MGTPRRLSSPTSNWPKGGEDSENQPPGSYDSSSPLKEPPQWLQVKQQTSSHLIGSEGADDVLIHCQDVTQTTIKWPLLIDRCPTSRLEHELHHVHASACH